MVELHDDENVICKPSKQTGIMLMCRELGCLNPVETQVPADCIMPTCTDNAIKPTGNMSKYYTI